MRTEEGRGRRALLAAALLAAAAAAPHGAWAAEEASGGPPATAMPHVLSELEGLKRAVYRQAAGSAPAGQGTRGQVFDHFEQIAPGRLSAAEYDGFVRDTVNFLDYVSEPTQTARRALGVWVVLFLLVFTWLAWLVKREYWKDVH